MQTQGNVVQLLRKHGTVGFGCDSAACCGNSQLDHRPCKNTYCFKFNHCDGWSVVFTSSFVFPMEDESSVFSPPSQPPCCIPSFLIQSLCLPIPLHYYRTCHSLRCCARGCMTPLGGCLGRLRRHCCSSQSCQMSYSNASSSWSKHRWEGQGRARQGLDVKA